MRRQAKLINDMEFFIEKNYLCLLIVTICLSGIQSQNSSKLYLEEQGYIERRAGACHDMHLNEIVAL